MKYGKYQKVYINRIIPADRKEFIVTPNITDWPKDNSVDTNEHLKNISCSMFVMF